MKALFSHASEVVCENGGYRPMRFTQKQIGVLDEIRPFFGAAARCATGVSLLFYTDASEVSFSYRTTCCNALPNSFVVYENDTLRATVPVAHTQTEGQFRYQKQTAGDAKLEIFLPSNMEIFLWELNLGNYRTVEPEKNIVLFCGDSLTQSLYITNPSYAFVTLLSKMQGYGYINRGIGSLYFEDAWLDEQDPVKPDEVFVMYGANDLVKHDALGQVVYQGDKAVFCTVEDVPELMEKAERFLTGIRRIYPNAQVHVITVVYSAAEMDRSRQEAQSAYNRALTDLCGKMKLHCIDGDLLIPHVPECRVADKIHFNELGNSMVAMALAKEMR